jgi:glycosyltransferase involved in cell wall biosynthesis
MHIPREVNCDMKTPKKNTTVSAIVLTYNEERHIGDCLKSLAWCDDVWVIDSYSTDRTLDIARQYTPHILQHRFQGFAAQRNWALSNPAISGEWILMLDADERLPKALQDEIVAETKASREDVVGYFIGRDEYYWGKYLRFGGASDSRIFRLWRKGVGSFPEDRLVHESFVADGAVGFLRHRMQHIARENLTEYIDKVNRYSSLEAARMFATDQELYTIARQSYTWKNQALQFIFKYLPCKPLFVFLFSYVVLGGFRDGHEGFLRAAIESFYAFASYGKLWELKQGIVRVERTSAERGSAVS